MSVEVAYRDRLQRLQQDWTGVLAGRPDPLPSAERETVWDGSEFVALSFLRDSPGLLDCCQQGFLHQAYAAGDLSSQLSQVLDGVRDEAGLELRLRHFRRQQMVRIIWRDICRLAELDETLEDLSELADCCVRQALDRLHAWQVARSGVPRDKQGVEQKLIVLAMGKLGARELNLSSDIDLIFCFPRHGRTDGRRVLENESFFVKLGRKLIHVLSSQTADGFVFRVDMRLRPFGDSGPLVASFGAMETYYQAQARGWERYAMVKARPLTGEPADIAELMALLQPFVYRRYIDFSVIEAIRDMKRMIVREMYKKGMDANIKLGSGGIREIEFLGQAFQLVRGGRETDLQIRPIQPVLRLLGEKQLLPDHAVEELLGAYRFLRLTENRIQAWRDEQTHLLPADDDARARIARSMGFDDWDAFYLVLQQYRTRVQGYFDLVFEAPQAEQPVEDTLLSVAWMGDPDDPSVLRLFEDAGFADPAPSLQALQDFRDATVVRAMPARGRELLDRLMPLLLEAISAATDPDITLDRILKLLVAIAGRTAYLDLLVENPPALSHLVRLVSESAWVVSQLIHQPILLDELLDPRRLYSPLLADELKMELDTQLASVDEGDLEQEMERLRQFSQGNRLRVAAADIAGAIPLMVVSDYLSEIAEVSLAQVQASAWRDLTARYGYPGRMPGRGHGFAIIGYGKLGGLELGYGSDLDLIFLHGSSDFNAMTDGKRSVGNDVFYARLGQRVIHMLNTRMPSGLLYETDMRLRPNGNSGMLVSSLAAFERYQLNNAWTWEHQALVRARAVSGDADVIDRFNSVRERVLRQQRDAEVLRADVLKMRRKMRENLDKSHAGQFDIKQGVGALVDIEFLVQFSVLRWAHGYPQLTTWTDNARLLEMLTEYELLEGGAAEYLLYAYQKFRAVGHRSALQELPPMIGVEELVEERSTVSEIWQRVIENP